MPAEDLAEVLVDAVGSGASVGFLEGLERAEAAAWWSGLEPAVVDGTVLLWVAEVDGRVVGTVQVRLAALPNARHRAELAKLLELGVLDVAPGMTSQRGRVFLATRLVEGFHEREHEEQDMRSAWFPRGEFEAMITRGEITDAQSIAAYTMLLLHEHAQP